MPSVTTSISSSSPHFPTRFLSKYRKLETLCRHCCAGRNPFSVSVFLLLLLRRRASFGIFQLRAPRTFFIGIFLWEIKYRYYVIRFSSNVAISISEGNIASLVTICFWHFSTSCRFIFTRLFLFVLRYRRTTTIRKQTNKQKCLSCSFQVCRLFVLLHRLSTSDVLPKRRCNSPDKSTHWRFKIEIK